MLLGTKGGSLIELLKIGLGRPTVACQFIISADGDLLFNSLWYSGGECYYDYLLSEWAGPVSPSQGWSYTGDMPFQPEWVRVNLASAPFIP